MEENSYLYKLEFMSNGSEFCIEFMGLQIWDSENDEREYDDDMDCYAESIKSYENCLYIGKGRCSKSKLQWK